MKKNKIATWTLFVLLSAMLGISCENKAYNNHYNTQDPSYVDGSVLDVVLTTPEYSVFAEWMTTTGLVDTLQSLTQPFTLFVPSNEMFEEVDSSAFSKYEITSYHILPNLFLPSHISGGVRKFITFNDKYTTLSEKDGVMLKDGVAFHTDGKSYKDGVIYTTDAVIVPIPTVYDYCFINNPILADWYRFQDSTVFDLENSTPIDFDDLGNTVYDSVITIVNRFDIHYFPIATDFKDNLATFLLFSEDDYKSALNTMASSFGGTGDDDDYKLIPKEWQYEVFIPTMMDVGVFAGEVDYSYFAQSKVLNINNRYVNVDKNKIDEAYSYKCSNGLIYRYTDFSVPDSLYKLERKIEGEDYFVKNIDGNWFWDKSLVSASKYSPIVLPSFYNAASGGAYASIQFKDAAQAQGYAIEFKLKHIFAGAYEFKIHQHKTPACKYNLYINGELKKEKIDNSRFYRKTNGLYYTSCDVNPAVFGDMTVRLEFVDEPDYEAILGLNFDYFELNLR